MKLEIAAVLLFAVTGLLVQNSPAQDDTIPPAGDRLGGTIHLFNGKDFTGFTFCMKGGADPMQTWSVTNGIIHCTGKPIGYLRTTHSYSNYFLTVEWRFEKIGAQKGQHRHPGAHPVSGQSLAQMRAGAGQTRPAGRSLLDDGRGS